MFKSYRRFFDKDISSSKIQIVDDNFIHEEIANDEACRVIIRIYSEKQLDVARNLVAFILWREKKSKFWGNIDKQIESYLKYVKDFEIYLPEIKKYLLFY